MTYNGFYGCSGSKFFTFALSLICCVGLSWGTSTTNSSDYTFYMPESGSVLFTASHHQTAGTYSQSKVTIAAEGEESINFTMSSRSSIPIT